MTRKHFRKFRRSRFAEENDGIELLKAKMIWRGDVPDDGRDTEGDVGD